jgi:hypothetical protein
MKTIAIYAEVLWCKLLRLFHIKKDPSHIPYGVYCYVPDRSRPEKSGVMPIKLCKYYRSSGEKSACTYVGFVGWDPCLNDQCKICDVNNH